MRQHRPRVRSGETPTPPSHNTAICKADKQPATSLSQRYPKSQDFILGLGVLADWFIRLVMLSVIGRTQDPVDFWNISEKQDKTNVTTPQTRSQDIVGL